MSGLDASTCWPGPRTQLSDCTSCAAWVSAGSSTSVKALGGVEARNAVGKRLAGSAGEERHARSTHRIGRHPWRYRGGFGGIADARIDPFRDRNAAERGPRGFHQRAVQRHRRQRCVEQRGQMLHQIIAHRLCREAGIEPLPIQVHPGFDQRLVHRPLAAQHQIDAGRLVQKFRPVEAAAHFRFQLQDQPRQQGVVQRVEVDRAGARRELVPLWSSPKPMPPCGAVSAGPKGRSRA